MNKYFYIRVSNIFKIGNSNIVVVCDCSFIRLKCNRSQRIKNVCEYGQRNGQQIKTFYVVQLQPQRFEKLPKKFLIILHFSCMDLSYCQIVIEKGNTLLKH